MTRMDEARERFVGRVQTLKLPPFLCSTKKFLFFFECIKLSTQDLNFSCLTALDSSHQALKKFPPYCALFFASPVIKIYVEAGDSESSQGPSQAAIC